MRGNINNPSQSSPVCLSANTFLATLTSPPLSPEHGNKCTVSTECCRPSQECVEQFGNVPQFSGLGPCATFHTYCMVLSTLARHLPRPHTTQFLFKLTKNTCFVTIEVSVVRLEFCELNPMRWFLRPNALLSLALCTGTSSYPLVLQCYRAGCMLQPYFVWLVGPRTQITIEWARFSPAK